MRLASPKGNHKRKTKLPCGAGKGTLWPENDGKKIKTGRKYSYTPIYYVNYKKEDRVNALIGLIREGVARTVATEERHVNVSKRVTMEHCFKEEGKHQDNFSTFKDRKRNYMKGKIYLKQQLIKDTFEIKRCGKGLLVEIN